MRIDQWDLLIRMVHGQTPETPQSGFIIDSPWLPGWFGTPTINYYTHDAIWFEANKKAVELFPQTIFFPGFWSEYGMCTEPSAFGARLIWTRDSLPHADKVIHTIETIDQLKKPNVRSDGLLPFMIHRLLYHRKLVEDLGHHIKFAVSRGPLNIASFLMGTTELMTALITDREKVIQLLDLITDFTMDWLRYQKDMIDSIEGIMILDDLVGFVGELDFHELALPRFKELFSAFPSRINLFHNDAHGLVCAPHLKEMGCHIFNFSFEHGLAEMQAAGGDAIILMGNIPPRDVLAQGAPGDVRDCLRHARQTVGDPKRILWSVGGGMPQDVSNENLHIFIKTVEEF